MNKILSSINACINNTNEKILVDSDTLKLACESNVAPFLYLSLDDNTDSVIKKKLKQLLMTNIIYDNQQESEYKIIKEAFEKEKVEYSFLKGFHLKRLYPESYLRYMCDFDILVRKSDLKRAGEVLESHGYKKIDGSDHDITYSKKPFHVELHFQIIPRNIHGRKYFTPPFSKLNRINDSNEYIFSNKEDEYIFYFFHMLKHYEERGIGIRNFVDLYLFIENNNLDWEYIQNSYNFTDYIEDCYYLENFIKNMFDDNEENAKLVEEIIHDKTYGSKDKEIKNELNGGSSFKWFIKKAFPSLTALRNHFPILRYRFMYIFIPLMYLIFWFKYGIFKLGYSISRIRRAKKLSKEKN